MKVSALIALLHQFDGDLEVGFGDYEYGWTGIERAQLHVVNGWNYDIDTDTQERTTREVVQLT